MGKHRTGGMTTIGILNLVFGPLLGLYFLLMILGASFMAAAGSAMGGDDGADVAAVGGFLILVGIAAFAVNLMLFIGGIGVLKLAPWGRTLSVASGSLGVVVYGSLLIGDSFQFPYLGMLAYCVVLIGLFFTPAWKATFCSGEGELMAPASAPAAPPETPEVSPEASEPQEAREAA